jgi:hypothetical protein
MWGSALARVWEIVLFEPVGTSGWEDNFGHWIDIIRRLKREWVWWSEGVQICLLIGSKQVSSNRDLILFCKRQWNDNARKLPLAPRWCRFPFFLHLLSEEMTCCGSKYDFSKKLGGLCFSAKVQNHPGSSEIGRNLHKIQKIPPKAAATKRELICIFQVV